MSGTWTLPGPAFRRFLDSYKSRWGILPQTALRHACIRSLNYARNAPACAQGRDSMHRIAAITTSRPQTWTSSPTFWNT